VYWQPDKYASVFADYPDNFRQKEEIERFAHTDTSFMVGKNKTYWQTSILSHRLIYAAERLQNPL